MSEKDPAFPSCESIHLGPVSYLSIESKKHGLTIRDYFAAKAMQGILAGGEGGVPEELAKAAYTLADAMLAERSKGLE